MCCYVGVTSDFCVNKLLERSVGLRERVNMSGIHVPSTVNQQKIQPVAEDQLKPEDKARFDQNMEEFKSLCLSSYDRTNSGVIKKSHLPRPRHMTIHTDQLVVMSNTIQNSLLETLIGGLEQWFPTWQFQCKDPRASVNFSTDSWLWY